MRIPCLEAKHSRLIAAADGETQVNTLIPVFMNPDYDDGHIRLAIAAKAPSEMTLTVGVLEIAMTNWGHAHFLLGYNTQDENQGEFELVIMAHYTNIVHGMLNTITAADAFKMIIDFVASNRAQEHLQLTRRALGWEHSIHLYPPHHDCHVTCSRAHLYDDFGMVFLPNAKIQFRGNAPMGPSNFNAEVKNLHCGLKFEQEVIDYCNDDGCHLELNCMALAYQLCGGFFSEGPEKPKHFWCRSLVETMTDEQPKLQIVVQKVSDYIKLLSHKQHTIWRPSRALALRVGQQDFRLVEIDVLIKPSKPGCQHGKQDSAN
ncbi:hypothetical protein RF11_03620 [Thelohanellus kitauei]|uniref:Uncharacterized protein n=1 Tax=Thelohanellus kitauei TaxID=669202 RepID=A0A0C2MI85_THEKT|nr:hypothetical protein RF11_03620 [Thelohanellus kitauei]